MSVIEATKDVLTLGGFPRPVQTVLAADLDSLVSFIGDNINAYERNLIREGDSGLVAQSERFLGMIEAVSPEAMSGRETVNSVTGGAPNVPAYLSGSPMAMRQRRPAPQKAPLRIVITPSVLNNWEREERMRRGAATIALLRTLEREGHAVELYLAQFNGTYMSGVRLPSSPMSLAQLAWIMCTFDGLRAVGLASNERLGMARNSGPSPFNDHKWRDQQEPYTLAFATLLDVDPSTVIAIPAGGDAGRKIFSNDKRAAAWVSRMYQQAITGENI